MIEQGNGDSDIESDANDEELEDLKKQFIVDSKKFEYNRVKDYLKEMTKYCKISREGKVFIENKNLTKIDTIALILLAKYIGNKLDERIPKTSSPDELAKLTKIVKNSVTGHITTLDQRGFINKPKEGIYQFNPSKIDDFLLKLKAKYHGGKNNG